MPVPEPVWCLFCEDRPAVGGTILVYEGTQDEIPMRSGAGPMPACEWCGERFTGTEAATDPNGRVAVIQYQHPDYPAVADQAVRLAARLRCVVCGDSVPSTEMAMTKFLRMCPEIAENLHEHLRPVCGHCDMLGLCPCCGKEGHSGCT